MTRGPDHHASAHDPDHQEVSSLGDLVLDEAFWDRRYRSTAAVWSGRPNPQLVVEAADLAPGTALDAGCGEGADALWLATLGWRVTAVDISTVALDRAAAHARQVGADVAERISWQQADLTSWVPPVSTFDLVSAQFLHLPTTQRAALHHRLAAAVALGGSLLVVGHHPTDLQTTAARPPIPELYFTAADAAAALDPDQWDVVVSDTRARTAPDPAGRSTTVHDAVLRARRRSP